MESNKLQKDKVKQLLRSTIEFKKGKRSWCTILTIASFFALLLLTTPVSMRDLVTNILFFVCITFLFLWKNAWSAIKVESKSLLFASFLFSIYSGFIFYKRWKAYSLVKVIASVLHISAPLLAAIAAVCLSVYSVLSVFCVLQKIKEWLSPKSPISSFKRNLLCGAIAAFLTIIFSQGMIQVDLLSMGILKWVGGSLIVFILIMLLYCLLGSAKVAIPLGTSVFMIISTANVYVYNIRTRLFDPIDLLSLKTAMNVANNYNFFPIPVSIILGWLLWAVLCVFLILLCAKEKKTLSRQKRISLFIFCLIGTLLVCGYTVNLKTYHWRKQGAENNGYILDFVSKIKEAYISKPKRYDPKRIEQLSDRYELTTDTLAPDDDNVPHIIVIMDEAFSNLGILGEITTDVEVTPYILSLKENTISGYALSSVYGGNTANSEFEFLTGNSMAWFSPNSVPYQQHMHSSTYSVVSYLKTYYDYQCIAMHPYLSSGWNRPIAYDNLGFDECFFIEDFPQKDYIRKYISDQEMFETIVQTYEKQHDKPLFLFGVTMQNHGDYAYSGENYSQSVSLVGYDNQYSGVDQYLSLIHETDKAVEYLISYFSQVEDEVIVVFFGDHQPIMDEKFYGEVMGGGSDTLENTQKKFTVPFFIWANYDIEESNVECTSLNYLSTYMYEAAGIPLPLYNQFLSEMEEKIPAINANGYYSLESQCYLPVDKAPENEQYWLDLYQSLQYNNLHDQEHRNEDFFPVLA